MVLPALHFNEGREPSTTCIQKLQTNTCVVHSLCILIPFCDRVSSPLSANICTAPQTTVFA